MSEVEQSDTATCGFSEVQLNIGADVEGYVSYTNSSQDFFIQLSDSFPRLCQLMDEMEAMYSSGDIDGLPVDSIKPGSICVAKFADDGGWYRALVKKYLSDTEVEVEFVDYGNSDTVQVKDVKPLKTEFADFPKQAIHCKLDTGKKTLSTDADELFKNSVEEKAFTVVFTSRDNGIWNVTLRDGSISVSERLSLLANEFSTMDIVEGQKEKVYISHVENPGEFYIQFISSVAAVDDLLESLSEEYHTVSANVCPLSSFDVGMPCCVQYSVDRQWNRAVVEEVLDGKQEALVRFVDFGNSETVKTAQIKNLKKEYMSLPRQAVCCSLGDPNEEWSSTASALFEEMANSEEEFPAKFVTHVGKKWIVALEKNNVSVSDMLKSKDGDVKEPITETLELKYPQLAKGITTEVYISHIDSPNDFFVQISETAELLEEMRNKIGEIYGSLGSTDFMLENCNVGSVCCVPFSEDNCFYRGIVKRLLPDSQVEVEFVDYGNSDTVPLTLLKKLSPDIAKPPRQAVKCGLADIKSDCTDKETSLIEALLDTPLKATFVEQEETKWKVLLEHDGRCVNKAEELISIPLSETSKSRDIPVVDEERELDSIDVKEGQTAEVFLVHTNDPSSFYIQFSESSADIDTIMTEIESIYPNLGPSDESCSDVTVNSLCCARFEEDQQWYRAIVRKVSPDSLLEVEFVDYGNTQVVALSSVKRLRQELRKLPRQAMHCGIANVEKREWTEDDVSFFHNTLYDKPITASFVNQEEDKWLVQLICEGVCMNTLDRFRIDQGRPSAEHGVQQEKEGFMKDKGCFFEPVLGTREPVYLLSTESDGTLWLQLSVTEKELETLMISISDCGQFQKLDLSQLKEGLPCLGKFTDDDKWYRACIIEYNDDSVHVRYVDYGNSEWVSCDRLGVIPNEFLQLPVQAFHCRLQGVQKLNGDQLFELCDQKLLEVEVISLEPTGCYVLNLFDPECDKLINDLLIDDNFKTSDDVIASAVAVATDVGRDTFKKPILNVGDELTLYVTVVDSPSSFWCQFGDEENQLETLMGQIDNFYSKLQDGEYQLESPTPGLLCCAQYTADDVWYRAVVQEMVDDENISVHFVDYGNDERLLRTRVKALHEQFQSLPIQAVKCSLFGVEPSNGECWSNEANEKFHFLCSDKALSCKIVAIDGSVQVVELSNKEDADQPSINSQLLTAELARTPSKHDNDEVKASSTNVVFKLLEFCVESKVKVKVTSIVNPGEFWCQVTDSNDELFALVEELEKYYSSTGSVLTGPSVGLPCCAKFEEDKQWYRAIITDVGTSIKVRYVDYGNTATLPLSDIKFIDEQFLALPVQALLCSLHGANPDADGSWPADGTEYFQGLVLDQEMELTVIAVESGKYVVTLTSAGGVDLGTAMSGQVPPGMLFDEANKSHEVSDEHLTAENSQKQVPTNTRSTTDSQQQEVKKEIVIESVEQLQRVRAYRFAM